MATYSDAQKERILSFPIESLLAVLGKRTDHRGHMYYSPFRDEAEPSLSISRELNVWKDFGEDTGGNVLTMASRLLGIPMADAWDYVAGLDPNIVVIPDSPAPAHRARVQDPMIVIDRVEDSFRLRKLVSYAAARGIPLPILSRYCRQVTYHVTGHECTRFTAIGFPTAEGWVLRRPFEGRGAKRCTGSCCSLLGPSGEPATDPASQRVELFEGFFDFLSWLVLKDTPVPCCDVCVLNSTSNLSRAMDFLAGHERISCWLDNDPAGKKALAAVRDAFPRAEDHLRELGSLDDVNELLVHRQKKIVADNSISLSHQSTIKQ